VGTGKGEAGKQVEVPNELYTEAKGPRRQGKLSIHAS